MSANPVSVSDLVLKVPQTVDPSVFDLDAYEDFIQLLAPGRPYQEDALREALRFLVGGEVTSITDLASRSFASSPALAHAYGSLSQFLGRLPLAQILAASIDLATATGKSYVIYGLARILLNEGVVDRVLVLCPSTTIESGLLNKFLSLSGRRELTEALPQREGTRSPEIIQATQTVEPGMICVENIHAVYSGTRSAIGDSLKGHGDSTLVLNDEAHHIYTPARDKGLKRWQEFLENPEYGFLRIMGFSGTCYIGNEYFPNVIYRYSLKSAMDDRTVKRVWYVDQDTSRTEDEAFQKMLSNHERNRLDYQGLKPLTIVVTKTITAAEELGKRLEAFLETQAQGGAAAAEGSRVLVVSSDKKHETNVAMLPAVDSTTSPVEWIVSVSMLTEGWDVKNVFQIVPHEQRAFNSKLLIAQVLGRGLRIPEGLAGQQPAVTVFNHERWAPAIRHLVEEVMESGQRLAAYPVAARSKYDFALDQVFYKEESRTETVTKSNGNEGFLKTGLIPFVSQADVVKRATSYSEAGTSHTQKRYSDISYRSYSVAEAVRKVMNRLRGQDLESGSDLVKKLDKGKLERAIRASLLKVGEQRDAISDENIQRVFSALGPLLRPASKQVRMQVAFDKAVVMSTADMQSKSVDVGLFGNNAALFYDDISLSDSRQADQTVLHEIDNGHPYRSNVIKIPNSANFKTPTNIVLVSHKPEKEFVQQVLRGDNAKSIDAWVKSPDSGFYEIGFSWRRNNQTRQGSFNPDFFIVMPGRKNVLVVEVKADDDVSDENKGKFAAAQKHFQTVNAKQRARQYFCYFLSPRDYDQFFGAIRDGKYQKFQSTLMADLSK